MFEIHLAKKMNGGYDRTFSSSSVYVHKSTSIASPEPHRFTAESPLGNGFLDFTDQLTQHFVYGPRTIEILVEINDIREKLAEDYSNMLLLLHGEEATYIYFQDIDPKYYYVGTLSVGPLVFKKSTAEVKITVLAQPYKRRLTRSSIYNVVLTQNWYSMVLPAFSQPFKTRFLFEFDYSGVTPAVFKVDGIEYSIPQGESDSDQIGFFIPEIDGTDSIPFSAKVTEDPGADTPRLKVYFRTEIL